jgi:hypothetical protein
VSQPHNRYSSKNINNKLTLCLQQHRIFKRKLWEFTLLLLLVLHSLGCHPLRRGHRNRQGQRRGRGGRVARGGRDAAAGVQGGHGAGRGLRPVAEVVRLLRLLLTVQGRRRGLWQRHQRHHGRRAARTSGSGGTARARPAVGAASRGGGGKGEGLRLAALGAAGVEQQRAVLVVLLQQARVLEARDHGLLALDARERHGAHLLGVEAPPALPVKLIHKPGNLLCLQEINEAVSNIALVLEINR